MFGRRTVIARLDDVHVDDLDAMARKFGVTRSTVVRLIIRQRFPKPARTT